MDRMNALCLGTSVLLVQAVLGGGSPALGQSCASFQDIIGTVGDYSSYQIKFTWIGEQTRSKPTFGVAGNGTTFDITDFVHCRLPSGRYVNDDVRIAPKTITLSGSEIDHFISLIAARPELQTTNPPPDGALSWSIFRPQGGGKVFEHVSNTVGARTVLLLLLDSLDTSQPADVETTIRVKRMYVGDL